ncbi:MAG: rRNA maturation RNase YbeY [Candidatus Acidiferrales bacterium]
MILNQQRRVRVSIAALDKFLAATQKRLRLPADSLTVALVSDPQMARWNAAYRGKNRPTEVLSFPADGPVPLNSVRSIRERHSQLPASAAKRKQSARRSRASGLSSASSVSSNSSTSSYLGDIAIAPAVARRNALRFGRTFDQEMRILILHGVLHLMGYDHETDQGQMTRRENRLRRDLGLA